MFFKELTQARVAGAGFDSVQNFLFRNGGGRRPAQETGGKNGFPLQQHGKLTPVAVDPWAVINRR